MKKHLCLILIFFVSVSIHPVTGLSYNNDHYSVLLQGVKVWNALKASQPEKGFDLSGADMKGKNLKGIDFSNTNLKGAILKGADLSDADLRGASLDKAVLKSTLLYDALLRDASLRETDLEEAELEGADLRGADLDGAVLKQADLAEGLLREANLRGVDLRAANLKSADLAGANLDGAYLWKAVLDGANLDEAVVTQITVVETGNYADQAWAEEKGAVLSRLENSGPGNITVERSVVEQGKDAEQVSPGKGAATYKEPGQPSTFAAPEAEAGDTAKVALDRSWPVNPVEQKIRFGVTRKKVGTLSYDVHQRELLVDSVSRWNKMRKKNPHEPVRLAGAKMSRKVLEGADLRNADLSGALLKRTDLVEADLRGANLSEANLREADLTNADLQGADLRGAYLWRANFSWTKLNGVVVNAQTVLETGKKATPEWAAKKEAVYR